jgi:hypothetical protein
MTRKACPGDLSRAVYVKKIHGRKKYDCKKTPDCAPAGGQPEDGPFRSFQQ